MVIYRKELKMDALGLSEKEEKEIVYKIQKSMEKKLTEDLTLPTDDFSQKSLKLHSENYQPFS